ncbi:hypothetical protein [uncultured Cohaesibacter sp.]|uniref:hypothetical protein n=1 Tax=uncultured Cohaesibacter sp. TaxID=1002546 RepID=UPI0029C70475|nr:hypothetical protein [uncultured Cohaesibacter sp.]
MKEQSQPIEPIITDLFSVTLTKDWDVTLHMTPLPIIMIALILLLVWVGFRWFAARRLTDFEIEGAELGIGDYKVSFKPNETDRQIAYSIWVELSTRKIGLPIDVEDDVIAEIYDSWYSFFGVTRELIKDIPVSKVRNDSTGKIIELSIEVLNGGLRPHLTKWQARYRHWYQGQMEKREDASPQELQKKFPDYDALCADLLTINNRLITYRVKLNELVRG